MKQKPVFRRLIPLLFILSFGIVLFVSLAANSFINYSINTMEYNIEQRLIAVAERLAELVTYEELDRYRYEEDMKLPEYQALRHKLLEFSENANVLYVYYVRAHGNRLYYIIDNDFDEATRVGLDTPPFFLETVPWLRDTLDGRSICSGLGNYDPNWEGLLSAHAPVFNSAGEVAAIASVDYDDTSIVWAKNMVNILTVLQIIMVAIVFITGLVALVRFRKQAQAAREANAYKSQFFASMSHEIKTPLTVISVHVQQANDVFEDSEITDDNIIVNKDDGETILYSLKRAQEEIMRTARITESVIRFSSMQMEKTNMEYLDINALLKNSVDGYCAILEKRGNRLVVNIEEKMPSVYGNNNLLVQVMANLLSNANKHTEKGEITVTALTKNKFVRVSVKDSGAGITKELLPRVFDPNVSGTGSTGIGLTICKEIIESHNGTIEINSTQGEGTEVSFSIPAFGKGGKNA